MNDLSKKGGVIVAWLMGGQSTPGFVASIAALTAVSPQYGVNLLGAIPKVSGPRIAAARNAVVTHFLSTQGEWLFMVDDDMVFDSDALVRLLQIADKRERPIVGGFAYAAGRDGYFSTIWTLDDNKNPVRVDDYPPDQLVRVVGTGAACLLVHRSVFEAILEKYGDTPWPFFQETSLNGNTVGEDFTFCIRAGEAGFPIHVDTGVEFGHEKMVNVNREFVDGWRKNHRVIVTGTGRCGTGYVSTVLNQAGIPATHEGVFNPEGDGWEWQRVECSWMAAPHLSHFDGYVVHLVRHPLAVVNSFVGIEFFTNSAHEPYLDYVIDHLEDLSSDPVEAAMRFYVIWNRMIEPYADQFVRIEETGPAEFAQIAHKTGSHHSPNDMVKPVESVPTDYNSRPRAELTWADLPAGELKDELEQMVKEYGYDL